ncbi:MAG: hypothetical protein HY525_11445 [Betaproteobacteria bacterium]|nr:hypothetical protein [Betaproteobacteria bacterium]
MVLSKPVYTRDELDVVALNSISDPEKHRNLRRRSSSYQQMMLLQAATGSIDQFRVALGA